MRISRRHGRLRLRLEAAELELMRLLLSELEAVLAKPSDPDDAVLARLFPSAYRDDHEAEAEYRTLTESSLRTERGERLAACRADLDLRDIDLGPPEAARRWIQVLNDLRLALGTRIGITQDDEPGLEPAQDDEEPPRVVYHWLTAVQDTVVQALLA